MLHNVRVRFAPSPTGELHIGGARTALYCYLFAKQNNGQFVLRIEDTDDARSSAASTKSLLEDLQWLGLQYDEGPIAGTPDAAASSSIAIVQKGALGPYFQSQRLGIYKQYADKLLQAGQAYYCFLTDAEIDAQRDQYNASPNKNKVFCVQSPYRDWPLDKALNKIKQQAASGTVPANTECTTSVTIAKATAQGITSKTNGGVTNATAFGAASGAVVRFKNSTKPKHYTLDDVVRGRVEWSSDQVGDFVLMRSNNQPVYNFACVVDDHLMQISHVFRSEEHLNNTLRQLMLYEALGWPVPTMAHMSLILDQNRKKLSKRQSPVQNMGDQRVSVRDFRQAGYYAPALLNALALLGWTHPEQKEILSLNELVKSFQLHKLHKSPAMFDEVFFLVLNQQHLSQLASGPPDEKNKVWNLLAPVFKKYGFQLGLSTLTWQHKALEAFSSRLASLEEAAVVKEFYPLAVGELSTQVRPLVFRQTEGGCRTVRASVSDAAIHRRPNQVSAGPRRLRLRFLPVGTAIEAAAMGRGIAPRPAMDGNITHGRPDSVTSIPVADLVAQIFSRRWGQVLRTHQEAQHKTGHTDEADIAKSISELMRRGEWPPTNTYFPPQVAQRVIQLWAQLLQRSTSDFLTPDEYKSIQKSIQKQCGVKGKMLFYPLRWAIMGVGDGPGLKQLATLIPRTELLARAHVIQGVMGSRA